MNRVHVILTFLICLLVYPVSSMAQLDPDQPAPVLIRWSPDQTMLAVGYENGDVKLVDARTKDVVASYSQHSERISEITWRPDSKSVATSSFERKVVIFDLQSETFIDITPLPIGKVSSIDWSPDGTLIAIAQNGVNDEDFHIWDINEQAFVYGEATRSISYVKWSNDQNLIALLQFFSAIDIRSTDDYKEEMYLGLTLQEVRQIQSEGNIVSFTSTLAWNSDDTMVITGSLVKEVSIWDITDPEPIYVVEATDADINEAEGDELRVHIVWFDDKDNSFASISGDGTYRIWDLDTGDLSFETQISEDVLAADVSTDGKLLAYIDGNQELQIVELSDLEE